LSGQGICVELRAGGALPCFGAGSAGGNRSGNSLRTMRTPYGANMVAGSLHGPLPEEALAATRTQYLVPLSNPFIRNFEAVGIPA